MDENTPLPEDGAALVMVANSLQPVIESKKLDGTLKEYIAVLASRSPFSLNVKIGEQDILARLAEYWPDNPEWSAQAYQLWERINDVAHSIPATDIIGDIFLHVSAVGSAAAPIVIPEPREVAALAVFDSVHGVMHRCVVPAMDSPPSFEALAIPAGITLVCQPVAAENGMKDIRDVGFGAGENYYSERSKDKPPPREIAPPEETKNAAPKGNVEEEIIPPPPAETPAPQPQ